MNKVLKKVLFTIVFSFIAWCAGTSIYLYYFDVSLPDVTIKGIKSGESYAGTLHVDIFAQDEYKLKHISIYIDDKVILNKQGINAKTINYPLAIPTIHLENGKHSLMVEVVDSSRRQNISCQTIDFSVDNIPLELKLLHSQEQENSKIYQGNVLHIQFSSNKLLKKATVNAFSLSLPCVIESDRNTIYEAFVPVSTDEIPDEYKAIIEAEDFVGNIATLQMCYAVQLQNFKKQNIKLKNNKQEEIANNNTSDSTISIDDAEVILKQAAADSPEKKLWSGKFYRPCIPCPISTEFGVIRTSFERGRYRHDAVDFGATPKSPVWSCQDGIIVMKGNFLYYGNAVAIDHGCGIISIYGHLDTFAPVYIGQKIKRGSIIGTVGMTGYATGYHLHWEMRIANVKVNPLEWIKDDN